MSCRRNARCRSLEIGTAAKHTNVNVPYEKPYKGHKNKINNDRDAGPSASAAAPLFIGVACRRGSIASRMRKFPEVKAETYRARLAA